MYESFYGLKENAFSLTPDAHFLFLNARNKDALDQVCDCIERREGFSVIAGDIGTGKSTLCLALINRLAEKNVRTVVIQNPSLSELDILISILHELGVSPETTERKDESQSLTLQPSDSIWMNSMSKEQLLDHLNRFLVERAQENELIVLILDEAQNLTSTFLEELLLITNLETLPQKLLQVVFIGQLQLIHRFKSDSLRQLDQRVARYLEIEPLSLEDTEKYIRHRLTVAGSSDGAQFSDGAYHAIWRYSKGCPRLINLACDRALLAGYRGQTTAITPQLVRRAIIDLQGADAKGSQLFSPEWLRVITAIAFGAALFCSMGFWGVKWLQRTPEKINFQHTREREMPASESFSNSQNTDLPQQHVQEHESERDLSDRTKTEALKPSMKLTRIISFGRTLELIGEADAGSQLTVNGDPVEVSGDGAFKHFTKPFPQESTRIKLVLRSTNLAGISAELIVPYDFNDRN